MTQEELNELASDCRLAFGHQAGAYNDGVDAMLRAVSIAQAQAAVEPVGYFYFDDGVYKQAGDPISFPGCVKLYTSPPDHTKAMRLALEIIRLQREWIMAVPQDTVLPSMPGFDREWVDRQIAALEKELK